MRKRKIKFVIKADGRTVPFNFNKVKATCIRAGASNKLATYVAKRISDKIRTGTTTRQIYKMVLETLAIEDKSQSIGRRYRLKEAIMLMGPAGFSFENYVSAILAEHGFHIKSKRTKIKGNCVTHEIDIIANEDGTNSRHLIECKFHNLSGIYTGIKEALYTHARFLDLKEHFDKEMLVCNTQVSDDAITYGRCIDQKIISWRYPINNGLEKMIESKGLYPITILGLNKRELQSLSQNNMMLVKDFISIDSYQLAQQINIPIRRIENLQNLAKQIIQ
jgi:hypothetical protein